MVKNLKLVKEHINLHHKRPSLRNKDKIIKYLGGWLTAQIMNYDRKKQIMKNEKNYKEWTDFVNDDNYKYYFLSDEKLWFNNLKSIKDYIDEYHKKPALTDKNKKDKILCKWMTHQITNYNKKECIMKIEKIYKEWHDFINSEQYKKYFLSNELLWYGNFNSVKEYIDKNNKKPPEKDKNQELNFLGRWILTQMQNYKKKKQIMTNDKIYKEWTDFVNDDKYKKYFESNELSWLNNLNSVKNYIDEYNKRPSNKDKNQEFKFLGKWISHQITNYNKKTHVMKNEKIHKEFHDFINDDKYKKYFL